MSKTFRVYETIWSKFLTFRVKVYSERDISPFSFDTFPIQSKPKPLRVFAIIVHRIRVIVLRKCLNRVNEGAYLE
jgi:hypothetical protein